jgi:hypothetical protein
MVSATLNLPCVGQSKPVASPVRGSSFAGDLQIGQRRGLGNGLLHLRRKYLGTTTFWKNSRASITASATWHQPNSLPCLSERLLSHHHLSEAALGVSVRHNTSGPITIQPCNAVMFSSLRIDGAGPKGFSDSISATIDVKYGRMSLRSERTCPRAGDNRGMSGAACVLVLIT